MNKNEVIKTITIINIALIINGMNEWMDGTFILQKTPLSGPENCRWCQHHALGSTFLYFGKYK